MTEKGKQSLAMWGPMGLAIGGAIVSVTLAFAKTDRDVAELKAEVKGEVRVLQKEDEHLKEGITELKSILIRMERKLDRLANGNNRERGRGEGD